MKTITILFYTEGPLGLTKAWQPGYDLTWDEYVAMATQRPGEGITWRAVFKA
jgi:hypothetical protein